MSFFSGKRVLGHCDSDLFAIWWLVHLLDDSFGKDHPIFSDRRLCKSWLSLVNALDDAFAMSFSCQGSASSFVSVFLGDYYEP